MKDKNELLLKSGKIKARLFTLINASQYEPKEIFKNKINQFLSNYIKPKKKFSIDEIASIFSIILEEHFIRYDSSERERWRQEFSKEFLTKEDLKNFTIEKAWYNKYHKNLEVEIMEWMMGSFTLEEAIEMKKKGFSPTESAKLKYHTEKAKA